MKKNIWIVCNNKLELIEAQRRINAGGGLRAFCMISSDAVKQAVGRMDVDRQNNLEDDSMQPSLLLLDYESGRNEDFESLRILQAQPAFAGIPVFFMCNTKSSELDEECYALGATVVLTKPLSEAALLRIERASWQHEMTRNYEKVLQHQANELLAAKEIKRLNTMLESRNELLHQIFGKYFSDEIVEVILDNPQGTAIGGDKKSLTVMMADLRGFTSLSDRLSAETVIDILNHFLGEMTEVIRQFGGIIIEFIGDAILAVFGAPFETACSQADAIAAAIEMQNRMSDVNSYNRKNEYPDIEMGIGIHKGEAFIGNIGSEKFMRYNVIGQAVNLCSRVESYSVGGQILVSQETIKDIEDQVTCTNMFMISMKGIRKQIPVYEVAEIKGEHTCRLRPSNEGNMFNCDKEILLKLFILQSKRIIDSPIKVQAIRLNEKRIYIRLKSGEISRLESYMDVELLTSDTQNAYAKIMNITDEIIELHFTYLSEKFLVSCGYKEAD